MEDSVEGRLDKSPSPRIIKKSRQQQPGQYLCVDTRQELETVKTAPHQFTHSPKILSHSNNKGFHHLSRKKKALQDSAVQPDSLCKLKTTLAVNYVREILETNQPPSRPKSSRNLKKGRLKPLNCCVKQQGVGLTRCLGIQNDRRKKSLTLDNGLQVPVEAISPGLTRFSSANKRILEKDKFVNVDLRRLSLVDQTMAERSFSKNVEGVHCEQLQGCDLEIGYSTCNQPIEYIIDDNEQIKSDYIDCGDDELVNDEADIDLDSDRGDSQSSDKMENNCIYKHSHYAKMTDNACNSETNQEFNLKESDMRFPSHANERMKAPSKATPAELDSIQVKDIWKALNDSGFDISRDEVSRYKVNTTKSPERIKSAPSRRKNLQTYHSSKYTVRAKSAYGSNESNSGEKRSVTFESDALVDGITSDDAFIKQPKVGCFFEMKNSNEKVDQDLVDSENLEVVAVRKPVSKLPRQKQSHPLVSPLNFKINTTPKLGHFFYFAYGLNMNQKRLEIQLRCEAGERYWGLLFGFRLIFNKKGSFQGGVGFPNIAVESGFSVEGCVYELPRNCLPLLDTCVGFPKHYLRLVLPVWLCNSSSPDDHGVAQHCVPAVVYVAQNDWVVSGINKYSQALPSFLPSSFFPPFLLPSFLPSFLLSFLLSFLPFFLLSFLPSFFPSFLLPCFILYSVYFYSFLDQKMLDTSFTFKQCLLGTDLLTPNYQEFLHSLMK